MSLRQYLLPLSFILASFTCSAQSSTIEMNDSVALRSYSVVRGDTLLINYDSAYVLNKKTFKLYRDNYLRVKAGNLATKQLIQEYENQISLQDSMLKTKEEYYQSLKSNFDSLAGSSHRFLDRTDKNVTEINISLTTATNQLNSINTLLNSSLEKLKAHNRDKLKFAIGGFTIGLGVASLIFLVAN